MKQPVRSRLMDRLLEGYVLPPLPNQDFLVSELLVRKHTQKTHTALAGATVIEATNVARFFDTAYVGPGSGAAVWNDMKCLVPPHEKFFIEWEQPLVPALRMGVLFATTTPVMITGTLNALMGSELDVAATEQLAAKLRSDIKEKHRTEAKWFYLTLSFLEFKQHPDHITPLRGPYHVGCAAIDEHGALLNFELLSTQEGVMPPDQETLIGGASLVAWTTLAMMNCENIDTVPATIPPAFQKARTKRGKKPLVSYHTVRVNTEKTPRSIGSSPLSGDGTTRLHAKRGHMKDYRKGAGLFGRYKGLWYWGPQLAGSEAEGVIVSDYEVR